MLINLNVLHVAYFIKAMVDQLEKRSSRSGIVITSSVAADYPIPGGITYSCAKRYVTDLAIGLNYELKDKIDVMSYNPGFVATKLTKLRNSDIKTITSERAAAVCFRDLGLTPMSHGAFRHEVTSGMFQCLPRFCLNNVLLRAMKGLFNKIKKRRED